MNMFQRSRSTPIPPAPTPAPPPPSPSRSGGRGEESLVNSVGTPGAFRSLISAGSLTRKGKTKSQQLGGS